MKETVVLDIGDSDASHFVVQLVAPCIKYTLLALFCVAVLIFFNATLMMGFSYASYNATHNMTNGCLRYEPEPCVSRLTFYGQTSVLSLFLWASLLFVNEALLGIIMAGLIAAIWRYTARRYDEYRLTMLAQFPTPSVELDGQDTTEEEEEELSL